MDTRATILIVEDEPALRRFLELLLRRGGYDVSLAQDGVEALARAEEATPALVLLDLMLPRMDGLEVCRRLRARPETGAVPIFILTARASAEAKEESLAAGADEFILKPYNPQDLMKRIHDRLQGASD
jgi:two-component system phosphate regulon response regulator PhoB